MVLFKEYKRLDRKLMPKPCISGTFDDMRTNVHEALRSYVAALMFHSDFVAYTDQIGQYE